MNKSLPQTTKTAVTELKCNCKDEETQQNNKDWMPHNAGWLVLFNAKLSPKRRWQGPRSQKVGEEGDYAYRYTVTTRMTPALRWAAMSAILLFH